MDLWTSSCCIYNTVSTKILKLFIEIFVLCIVKWVMQTWNGLFAFRVHAIKHLEQQYNNAGRNKKTL